MSSSQGKFFNIQAAQEWSDIRDDDLPVEDTWVVIRDNNAYHTVHRFHPYFAMCPPPIARRAIETFSKPGDRVADPFCGAGVTLTEAMTTGRTSIGFDVLSMARFITQVKITPLDISLETAFSVVDQAERLMRKPDSLMRSLPPVYNRDYWFSQETQLEMAAIVKAIKRESDQSRRDFYRLAFSSLIRLVSNAGNLESHLHIKKGKTGAGALRLFRQRLFDMVVRERHFAGMIPHPRPAAEVHEADARNLTDFVNDESVDLIFTSPPYGSGTKYASVYRLQMELLGLRKTKPRTALESVKDFTEGLSQSFGEMYRILKPGATLALLYGTNKYYSSKEIAELAEVQGFKLETSIACPVIDESKMVRGDYRRAMANEHLLILVKGAG